MRSKKLNTINNKKSKNKLESKNLNTSISFVEKNYFFLKLNRLCPIKVKFSILVILLTNNCIIFVLQITGSLSMILFLFIIFFINQGENHNFIISSIVFIIIFSFIRIIIFVKNIKKTTSILLNLVYSMLIFIINIILLMIIMIMNKKKKNVLQNIDEIVYFTENNMPTQKKEKDINYMNNSPNNNILKKVRKTVKLVEDEKDIKNKNGLQ